MLAPEQGDRSSSVICVIKICEELGYSASTRYRDVCLIDQRIHLLMDEGFLPSDLIDPVSLEELRQYGVADTRTRQPQLSASKTHRFETAAAFEAAGLSDGGLPSQRAERTSPSLDVHHASPLTPLRKRDRQALDDFFESDRIQEIALDIHRYLARMYPEPCWEDEPQEFLRGFI